MRCFGRKMEDLVFCDTSSVFGATCLHVHKTVHVLFEIFERLGGVAARPQATTARMKHHMQDAATDLVVELPFAKLQYTAFIEGRRAQVEDEGGGDAPPSLCAPQDDRDPFPTPRRPRPSSLPVLAMSRPHV